MTGFRGSCEQECSEPGMMSPALLDYVTAFCLWQHPTCSCRSLQAQGWSRAWGISESWCTTYDKLSVLPLAGGLWGRVECLLPCCTIGFDLLCVCGLPGPFTKMSQNSLCVCYPPHPVHSANAPVPLRRPLMQIENDQSKLQPSPWKRSLTITGPY